MEIKTKLTQVNRTVMNNKQNKYIVIHYVGAVSTAKANADYFYKVNRQASAHYFVDENEIWQVVKEGDSSWHCGTTGKYYNNCRNSNSIGIEMCCYNNNGTLDIKEEVINRTIELTKELMAKYKIPVENVIRHYDVTHKCCPAPFVNNAKRWEEFKEKLKGKKIEESKETNTEIKYKVHIQDKGWTEWQKVGEIAGTTGENKRIEAIIIEGDERIEVSYRVHIEEIGWTDWVKKGEEAGTTGQCKRIEAIEIKSNRLLEIQEHIQDVGWLPSSKGTEIRVGTVGKALRLEAFKINIL